MTKRLGVLTSPAMRKRFNALTGPAMSKRLTALALALTLALTLLCAACSGRGSEGKSDGEYALWFAVAHSAANGASLSVEKRPLQNFNTPVETLLQTLLQVLFSGPESEELLSPFPAGLTVRSVSVTDGVASVDLSEGYGGLSGIDLTLADACIALTLCQLEDVNAVYLTVDGAPRPFRDQVLTPDSFLLDNALPSPTPT